MASVREFFQSCTDWSSTPRTSVPPSLRRSPLTKTSTSATMPTASSSPAEVQKPSTSTSASQSLVMAIVYDVLDVPVTLGTSMQTRRS